MKIDSNLLKLLMEMGFLAVNTGRLGKAAVIFKGVAQARPESVYPHIGLGCVAMGRGDYAGATEILNNAPVTERAERDLCQGFLGMALKLDGRHGESRQVLIRLQTEGENEVAVRMAGRLMEQ